jgi:hypothetical protein
MAGTVADPPPHPALTDAGHAAPVVFTTTTNRPGDGWDVAGTAAGTSFTARTDPTGQVVHLQIVG